MSENETEAEEKIRQFAPDLLKIKNTDEILKELDSLNFNEASLFPELDNLSHYLKTKV